jgi:hypothetical protein
VARESGSRNKQPHVRRALEEFSALGAISRHPVTPSAVPWLSRLRISSQPSPFDHVNPDADFLLCKDRPDAIRQSEEDFNTSLAEGWHRYTPALG